MTKSTRPGLLDNTLSFHGDTVQNLINVAMAQTKLYNYLLILQDR